MKDQVVELLRKILSDLSSSVQTSEEADIWKVLQTRIDGDGIPLLDELTTTLKSAEVFKEMFKTPRLNGLILPPHQLRPGIQLLVDYLNLNGRSVLFDPGNASLVIDNFLKSLSSKKSRVTHFAPLIGFSSTMSEFEIDGVLRVKRIYHYPEYVLNRFDSLETDSAVSRNRFVLEYVSKPLTLLEQHNGRFVSDLFEEAVSSLKLLKDCSIDVRVRYSFPTDIGAVTLGYSVNYLKASSEGHIPSETFPMAENEVGTLATLQDIQKKLGVSKFAKRDRIEISRQRLIENQTSSIRDKFINSVIALESMFGEMGDNLKFKIAMRCAFFLSQVPKERREIFDTVGEAYNIRSKIVHGKAHREQEILEILPGIDKIVRASYIRFCQYFLTHRKEINVLEIDNCILSGENVEV